LIQAKTIKCSWIVWKSGLRLMHEDTLFSRENTNLFRAWYYWFRLSSCKCGFKSAILLLVYLVSKKKRKKKKKDGKKHIPVLVSCPSVSAPRAHCCSRALTSVSALPYLIMLLQLIQINNVTIPFYFNYHFCMIGNSEEIYNFLLFSNSTTLPRFVLRISGILFP
jgi:hypothetical protein